MQRFLLLCVLILAGLAPVGAQLIISDHIDLRQPTQDHVLWTDRGDQLHGKLISLRSDSLYFRLAELEDTLVYHRREVAFIGLAGEPFPRFSKAATRYRILRGEFAFPHHSLLYSATALVPEQRGSYRNNMLLVNEFEFHPHQHFSLGAGAFVPALIILRAQARLTVAPLIHLGLNVNQYFDTFYPDSYTHPYAILTLGEKDRYINFTYGRWIQRFGYNGRGNSFPMITIGGSYTISGRWRAFFEGMLYHDQYGNYLLPTGYLNYLRRRSVYGFGLWGLPEDAGIPLLPWLSYSYLF